MRDGPQAEAAATTANGPIGAQGHGWSGGEITNVSLIKPRTATKDKSQRYSPVLIHQGYASEDQ